MKIVLLSCTKAKQKYRCRAEELYSKSSLFKKALAYARHINVDKIFVLSAKYGLLALDTEIDYYDKTLNNMSMAEVKAWSEAVITQLKEQNLLDAGNEFVILAGERYRTYILDALSKCKVEIPTKNMKIGEQLAYFNSAIKEK